MYFLFNCFSNNKIPPGFTVSLHQREGFGLAQHGVSGYPRPSDRGPVWALRSLLVKAKITVFFLIVINPQSAGCFVCFFPWYLLITLFLSTSSSGTLKHPYPFFVTFEVTSMTFWAVTLMTLFAVWNDIRSSEHPSGPLNVQKEVVDVLLEHFVAK